MNYGIAAGYSAQISAAGMAEILVIPSTFVGGPIRSITVGNQTSATTALVFANTLASGAPLFAIAPGQFVTLPIAAANGVSLVFVAASSSFYDGSVYVHADSAVLAASGYNTQTPAWVWNSWAGSPSAGSNPGGTTGTGGGAGGAVPPNPGSAGVIQSPTSNLVTVPVIIPPNAISIVQLAFIAKNGAPDASVLLPAVPSAGNMLLALTASYGGGNAGNVNGTAGWTPAISGGVQSGLAVQSAIKPVAGDSSTVMPFDQSTGCYIAIYELAGAASFSTVLIGGEVHNNISAATYTDPGIGVGVPVMAFSVGTQYRVAATVTVGAGWTQDGFLNTGAGRAASAVISHAPYTATGTATNTITWDAGDGGGLASLLVLLKIHP